MGMLLGEVQEAAGEQEGAHHSKPAARHQGSLLQGHKEQKHPLGSFVWTAGCVMP
jgi:hypothetical protein